MKNGAYALALGMFMAWTTAVYAVPFKVYPGAKLEDVYELRQPETGGKASKSSKVIVFTTTDLFENVVAFYRGFAKEYRMPGAGWNSVRLSSGQELREAYFVFDGASDITTSMHWVKIQRPYVGKDQPGERPRGKYEVIRDVTAIIEEDKRSYP